MDTKQRLELGDYNPSLKGLWVDVLLPSMLPHTEAMDLWDTTITFAREPRGKNGAEPDPVEMAQYWMGVATRRITRHIVGWNLTDATGNPLPLPSQNEDTAKQPITGGVFTIVGSWLDQRVSLDNEMMGKALTAGKRSESASQEESQ